MLPSHLSYQFWITVALCTVSAWTLPVPTHVTTTEVAVTTSIATQTATVITTAENIVVDLTNSLNDFENKIIEGEREVITVVQDKVKSCVSNRCFLQALLDSLPAFFNSATSPTETVLPPSSQAIDTPTDSEPAHPSGSHNDATTEDESVSTHSSSLDIQAISNSTRSLDAPAFTFSDASASSPPFLSIRHPSTLIISLTAIIFAIISLGILFKLIRSYFSNPRRRADRAARREEYRTRRLYRRAACRYKLKQFFTFIPPLWTRRHKEVDSEAQVEFSEKEKNAIPTSRTEEQVSSHVLGASILSIQDATIFVDNLIRHPNRSRLPPDPDTASTTSSDRTNDSTLPPYSLPPAYSQDLPSDPTQVHVMAGFRYTPSNSDVTVASSASSFIIDDESLESSIIDLQSRISEDTDSVV